MKRLMIIIGLVVVVGMMFLVFKQETVSVVSPTPILAVRDYKNIAYAIEGQKILLKDGKAETDAVPGSVEKVDTDFFGNELKGDFNNDGAQDVAFLLSQSGGGTGVFYYVVVALKTPAGYEGTNAVFLGDRIAPQTIDFKNGNIIVNYADRKPGEPFSSSPSVGVSKYLKISAGKLVEINK